MSAPKVVGWCTNTVRRQVMRLAWRWFRLKFSAHETFGSCLSLARRHAKRQYGLIVEEPKAAPPAGTYSTVPGSPLGREAHERYGAFGRSRRQTYSHVVFGR